MAHARLVLTPSPILASVMGLAYLLGEPARTSSKSFSAAKALADMQLWGAMFFIGAVVLTITLLAGHRSALGLALFAGGIMYSWWALCFVTAALSDPGASATAWAIHGFISAVHYLAAWAVWTHRL